MAGVSPWSAWSLLRVLQRAQSLVPCSSEHFHRSSNMSVGQEYVPTMGTLVNGNMDETCGPMVV